MTATMTSSARERKRSSRPPTSHHSAAWAKWRLCDTLERVSRAEAPDEDKRAEILPDLYRYGIALAEQRAAKLVGTDQDELVSTIGERIAVSLPKLDLNAPPAQQVTYLDGLLHHALTDACRALDPLGRGPRKLRRRYAAEVEAATVQAQGELHRSERDRILDDLAGTGGPALKLIVGTEMSPAEAIARVAGDPSPTHRPSRTSGTRRHQAAVPSELGSAYGDNPAETVVVAMAREQILKAIEARPGPVREYLLKVLEGLPVGRKPANFNRRLGPTLPALIASLVMDDAERHLERHSA